MVTTRFVIIPIDKNTLNWFIGIISKMIIITQLSKSISLLRKILLLLIGITLICILVMVFNRKRTTPKAIPEQPKAAKVKTEAKPSGPLANITFYSDKSRDVNKQAEKYRASGDISNAELLEKISTQPAAVWLTGPSQSDPLAKKDIDTVLRTSSEALQQSTVPMYELYAIPNRDACAEFSNGGFNTETEYLAWLDKILAALKTKAVFSVEADSIGHTLNTGCLTAGQKTQRFNLLKSSFSRLSASPNVLASYLDAGHSEWIPDPAKLVEPLKNAGIDQATGVAVNVSNFVSTAEITEWSTRLSELLGNKGVVIDTSRNGRGTVAKNITGDARWCNPGGRGLGEKPRANVSNVIHAYMWIKGPGESDGSCFGYPNAGIFVPSLAVELAKNAL